jgi:hypothetical protein
MSNEAPASNAHVISDQNSRLNGEWEHLASSVKHLILRSNEYIVFLDHDLDIDWATKDSHDEKIGRDGNREKVNAILNSVATAESIPTDKLTDKIRLNYKRQLGEAIARAFDGDFDSGERMIQVAEEFVKNRNIEQSRYLYLISGGILTLSIALLASVCWVFRENACRIFGMTGFYVLLATQCGALGAFLSIILRMGKANLDFNASKELHYLEATSRLFAGMISGFLIALTIKAGILLPVLSNLDSLHTAMLLGGLVAGSSERLAPSIIKKIDGSKNNK